MLLGIGIKCTKSEMLKMFAVIFLCDSAASVAGKLLSAAGVEKYINYFGVFIMSLLAYSAFRSINRDSPMSAKNIYIFAFSVAADASVVCMYLGMCGYNVIFTAALSALMHCVLVYLGSKCSDVIFKGRLKKASKFISACIFVFIALYKFKLILA